MAARPPIRALLLDLSGTLHVGSQALPSAVDALAKLRQSGRPFRFCSNTSKEGRPSLRARLRDIGFDVRGGGGAQDSDEELWTSLGAVGEYAKSVGCKRPFYLLSDSAREDVAGNLQTLEDDAPYDAVIVGLAPDRLSYDHLNTAFQILTNEHSSQHRTGQSASRSIPLIATHRARFVRDSAGSLSLGPGPFVAALENASGAEAKVVGKPSRDFFNIVIESMRLPFQEDGTIAIVGDDVETDLGDGAVELGLWRVLVRTGKYRPGDEQKPGLTPPDEVHDSFTAFVDSLLSSTHDSK